MKHASLPPDGTHGMAPEGTSPSLVVLLRPGWRLGARGRTLVSDAGDEVDLRTQLPAGSRVAPMVADLAAADPVTLSDDEAKLARYLHVFLLGGSDVEAVRATVADWAAVESVDLPPRISLP